jgi:hypothetical protein
MNGRMARVKAVKAGPDFTLDIEWADGSKAKADLTGLIHSSKHFGAFAEDEKAFRHVKPVSWGDGIEWDNGLDYSANTLKELADEQKPMSGAHLAEFVARRKLNNAEAAKLLHCTTKTLRGFFKLKTLPEYVAFAVRRFENDPTIFAAHYRPVTVRPRGRPKASAPS